MFKKELKRKRRHFRIRKKVVGTKDIPRLSVSRSLAHLQVQVVDDHSEKVLMGMSTQAPEVKQASPYGGNKKAAEALGVALAAKMKEKGIERICFDRGGYLYHGRVKTFADSLRKNGIKF